jgi:hypothetical protein
MSAGIVARIAGTPELVERLDAQDRRSNERHEQNVGVLGELKDLAVSTNGRVSVAENKLSLIADREAAAEVRKSRGVSLRQGILIGVFTAVACGVVAAVVQIFLM